MKDLVKLLVPVTQDDRVYILSKFGKTPSDAEEDLNVLKEWIREQPLLPQDIEDSFLEGFLMRNKFRMEQTKNKLISYHNCKLKNHSYFGGGDPMGEKMMDAKTTIALAPMHQLMPTKERVFVYKVTGNDHLYNTDTTLLYAIMVAMSIQDIEYSAAFRLVIDFEGFKWRHYLNLRPHLLAKRYSVFQDAFCARVSGIEVLHPPTFINIILSVLKCMLKPKLLDRITLHKDVSSLHSMLPKDCLPADYGGKLETLEVAHENMFKLMLARRDYILKEIGTFPEVKILCPV